MNPYSNLKIFKHHDILKKIEEGEWNNPIYVRLKPTNVCNHHCSYCTYGSGGTAQKTNNRDTVNSCDSIPFEKMVQIVNDFQRLGVKAVTFSGGGEPLTYSYLPRTLDMLKDMEIEVSLISNGELLEGRLAERFYSAQWVRISFDSPNEDEYCSLRGVKKNDYKKVVRNINDFAKKKDDDCVLGVNYVISKSNYKRIYEVAGFLKSLGVENVKFAAVKLNEPEYHLEIKDHVLDQIRQAKEQYEDESFIIVNNYENDWNDESNKKTDLFRCYTCRLVTVIGADQKVYLCHTRAYDSRAVVGDLRNNTLYEIWNCDNTRNKINSLSPVSDCNMFCPYSDRNRLIEKYLQTNRHINFI